jgi:hypothetical protein
MLLPTQEVNGQSFGHSVAMDGTTIVVGLPSIGYSSGYGKAHIYEPDGKFWSRTKVLDSFAPNSGGLFGWSVDIDGSTVVVGARDGNDPSIIAQTGTATVFEKFGSFWTDTAFLRSPDSSFGDQFGTSVAVSEQTIVVGAPFEGTCGAAYVYDKTDGDWLHSHTLLPTTCTAAQRFGAAVAIDVFAPDWYVVAVGDRGDPGLGTGAGAVHVFLRLDGTWSPTPLVTGDDTDGGDAFGSSVALSEVTLVVGAPGDDDLGSSSGSVYIFEPLIANWIQVDKITASNGHALADFGSSVAVDGGVVVAGAPGTFSSSGVAYLFEEYDNHWYESARLTASSPYGGEYFGEGVAVSGDFMVGGCPGDDEFRPGAGSARIFDGLNLIFADGFEDGDTDAWVSSP